MTDFMYDSAMSPRLISAEDVKERYPRVIARVRDGFGMVEARGQIVARTFSNPIYLDVRLDTGEIKQNVHTKDVQLIDGEA